MSHPNNKTKTADRLPTDTPKHATSQPYPPEGKKTQLFPPEHRHKSLPT